MYINLQPSHSLVGVSIDTIFSNMDRALPDPSLAESGADLDVFPGTEIMLSPNSTHERSAGTV